MNGHEELELTRAIDGLRRFWWLVVAGAVLLGLAFSLLFASSADADTEAKMKLVVADETRLAAGLGLDSSITLGASKIAVDSQYLLSSDAKAVVAEQLGRSAPTIELLSSPDLVTITLVDSSPQAAAEAANAYADAFRAHRLDDFESDLESVRTSVDERLDLVASQIDELVSGLDTAAGADASTGAIGLQYSGLVAQQADLQRTKLGLDTFEQQSRGGFEVLSVATAESSSRLPLIGGVLFGGACGAALACYLGLADKQLRSRRAIEALVGPGTVLGVVPRSATDGELDDVQRALSHHMSAAGATGWRSTVLGGDLPSPVAAPRADGDGLHVALVGYGACHADDLAMRLHTAANAGDPIDGVILTGVPRRRLRAAAR